MGKLITTLGAVSLEQAGMILPHEHVFTDLRIWQQPGYAQAEAGDVISLMKPELDKAKASGITAIVEATPVGVGRRADILRAVSKAAEFPLIVPTGVYREPWIPDWIHNADRDQIREWMESELTGEIEESGVQAGWIKLSAGDDGITSCEAKVLEAAAMAGAATNAVIGSHTVKGSVVRKQLNIIENSGYSASRFIWIHAQAEPDFQLHMEMARRGAWIEYDAIGGSTDDFHLECICKMLEAGMGDRILISQDRGWYDPALPKGGHPLSYCYICESFLPRLRQAGIDDQTIALITLKNTFNAFSR